MSFPTETEIREACATLREQGYKIQPLWNNWREKRICPLAAVAIVRSGSDDFPSISEAISGNGNFPQECMAFYYGFDDRGRLDYNHEQYELGQKLRKDWEEGKL